MSTENSGFPTRDLPTFDPATLVACDTVHRDVYTSEAVHQIEVSRLFRRAWLYAGHQSELPTPGDYLSLDLARQPVVIIRQQDGSLVALHNRCAHKGTPVVTDRQGSTKGILRCAYHGWTYKPDGSLLNIPLRNAYDKTAFSFCDAAIGLKRITAVEEYQGFIFVRLSDTGPSLTDYFGEALKAIDNMVKRSPVGQLRLVQPPLRHRIACNWKIYLENINDAVHPVSAHQSAWATARQFWQGKAAEVPKPMAIEQMLPFGAGYDVLNNMGARILPNGHSFFGTKSNIHSNYAALSDYQLAMHAAYGKQASDQILGFQSQNTVLYPGLSVKPSPLSMRVLRPVSAGETILEVWAFEAIGAPPDLLERALTYNRVAFSPMSVVAHDDIHIFEAVQQCLVSDANPWISLHRDASPELLAVEGQQPIDINSANEGLMRNQFRAWANLMSENPA